MSDGVDSVVDVCFLVRTGGCGWGCGRLGQSTFWAPRLPDFAARRCQVMMAVPRMPKAVPASAVHSQIGGVLSKPRRATARAIAVTNQMPVPTYTMGPKSSSR